MDPYYEHMHMYGRVPKGKGVDRNMNQFYGRKSLNGLTLSGHFSSPPQLRLVKCRTYWNHWIALPELDTYMLGFQRNLTRKQIAKRNAVVGAIIGGLVAVASKGYVAIKT